MKKSSWVILLVVVAVLAIGLAMYKSKKHQPQPVAEDQMEDEQPEPSAFARIGPNALYVSEQLPGSMVVINTLALEKSGFVVLHVNENGSPGAVVDSSALIGGGEHQNVEITLESSFNDGDSLIAMLHSDDGDGFFDITKDTPVNDVTGNPVSMTFSFVAGAPDPRTVQVNF